MTLQHELAQNLVIEYSSFFEKEFQAEMSIPMDATSKVVVNGSIQHKSIAGLVDTYEHIEFSNPNIVENRQRFLEYRMRPVVAFVGLGDFTQRQIAVDDKLSKVEAVGSALGRKVDQMRIDAMVAAANNPGSEPEEIVSEVPDSGVGLTFDKVLRARTLLNALNVPQRDRYAIISAQAEENLLQEERFTNIFYRKDKPLHGDALSQALGFTFIVIGDRKVDGVDGGLPRDGGSIRDNFFFHKSAVEFGVNLKPTLDVYEDKDKIGWVVRGRTLAGAGVPLPQGIVRVKALETI